MENDEQQMAFPFASNWQSLVRAFNNDGNVKNMTADNMSVLHHQAIPEISLHQRDRALTVTAGC